MLDAVFPSLMSSLGLLFGTEGAVPLRTGNRHNGLAEAPYNVYETKDGYLALICVSDAHWQGLVEAMGREDLGDDPRFGDMAARVANVDEIDRIIGGFARPWATEALFEHLRGSHVPCAPVRNLDEVVGDRHLHERRFLQELEHPEMGAITVFSSPMRFGDETPTEVEPSPRLGQDNESIVNSWQVGPSVEARVRGHRRRRSHRLRQARRALDDLAQRRGRALRTGGRRRR
jgi:CoA:oxalate CoA-transferase